MEWSGSTDTHPLQPSPQIAEFLMGVGILTMFRTFDCSPCELLPRRPHFLAVIWSFSRAARESVIVTSGSACSGRLSRLRNRLMKALVPCSAFLRGGI